VGVYFLETYDPGKLPVLFVHGIAGSPQDWRPIFETMDRRGCQPWFFHYPSGIRLDKAANALAGALIHLRQRNGFDRIVVVAHSMGGLVSRGAIQLTAELADTNFIPELVTISTPWGGHQAAELGVKHLKFPVPAWRDMAPGSAYLQTILSHPLPSGTRHDLIFGYQGSGSLGLPRENDGVVAVESELLPQVQEEAASVFGLPLDHTGILASPVTLRRMEQFISPWYPPSPAERGR
jgi:pimeloyl-ACP methyl ester carboxylesterase